MNSPVTGPPPPLGVQEPLQVPLESLAADDLAPIAALAVADDHLALAVAHAAAPDPQVGDFRNPQPGRQAEVDCRPAQ